MEGAVSDLGVASPSGSDNSAAPPPGTRMPPHLLDTTFRLIARLEMAAAQEPRLARHALLPGPTWRSIDRRGARSPQED
jgi:hypothetical protein